MLGTKAANNRLRTGGLPEGRLLGISRGGKASGTRMGALPGKPTAKLLAGLLQSNARMAIRAPGTTTRSFHLLRNRGAALFLRSRKVRLPEGVTECRAPTRRREAR